MTDNNASANSFELAAHASSASVRRRAFGQFMGLHADEQPGIALIFLGSEHRDLREAVLDYCSEDVVASKAWTEALKNAVSNDKIASNALLCQGLLVIFQRLSKLEDEFVAFYHKCLKHTDADVLYQAYCLAELREETSCEYHDFVKTNIHSEDEDMRIISIQALARLKPDWAIDALKKCAETAVGVEAFHILLSQIHICPPEMRPEFAQKIAFYIENERFAFAAVQALYEFGDASVVPALIRYARSVLSEPTTRIAAAAAAAKLGSKDGIKILKKFASSRHGNPSYAKEQLEKLGLLNT